MSAVPPPSGSVPPPLPQSAPTRDMTLPPQPGEDVGLYTVVLATPEQLVLSVSLGFILLVLIVCAIAVGWGMVNLWAVRGQVIYNDWRGKYYTIIGAAVIFAVFSLINVGRRLEVNRRTVRATRFFLFTTEHASHVFESVELDIKIPYNSGGATTAPGSPPPPPVVANNAILTLVGHDSGGPIRLKIGEAALVTKTNWPSLAAAAGHVGKVMNLPLVITGSPTAMSETARRVIEQIPPPA